SSPLHLTTAAGRFAGQRFALDRLSARLGKADSPIRFDTPRFEGNFAGNGINGTFTGATATIGDVPLILTEAAGKWRSYHSDIFVDTRAMVSDRTENPKFYPLRTDDLHMTIAGGRVRANGSLRHPGTGNRVVNVTLEHILASGLGHADLDVPSL